MASIDRTAYPRFKRVVSGRELADSFTPTSEEITWARGKTQSDSHGGQLRLDRVLLVDPATRRSEFDRMKTPAQSATLGKFKARLAHVQALDAIGPTEVWLDGVPPGKVMHFAGEARMANVDDMRKTGDAKRVTLLISLLHQQRIEARDEVVTMFCKRMAALHKKAKERLAELQEEYRAETERLVGVLGEVLAGAHEATTPPETADACAVAGDAGVEGEVAERAGRSLFKGTRRDTCERGNERLNLLVEGPGGVGAVGTG